MTTLNDKLQKKIREAEDETATEIVESMREETLQSDRDRAHFILGGINIADRVSESLGTEAIKAMIKFQDEKLYLALGYDTFVDFLNNSERTRITKQQFYDRKALFEKEGEAAFDLLTELGVSIRKRKLLGKGNIELEGETLIVHDGDETKSISIHDRSSILDAITALADANAEKSVKLTVQKEKIDKHDEKVRELYSEIDTVKASKIAATASDPHMIARVEAGVYVNRLIDAAGVLSEIEKDQFRDGVLEDFARWRSALTAAYKTTGSKKPEATTLVGDTFDEQLNNFLDTVDFDDVGNNDGELADKL